ncbi:LpqB family beta-propeller domain-containing protein [Actinoplanes sp. TRM 88003]|uniref:LpqB family beta-propeller domain-containing protein n=1 Tax=Paractinoplanes aksuensis TaxID=2939490 RepID=A0ABT1DQ68_9ACTN|nr:LpqB family beta-propeller domain-containing protein [Actinoplanes aksuensis]MCO8272972.1 LpqB family beta-propeller domain-containing protein [Actinoplanes aksuensis]
MRRLLCTAVVLGAMLAGGCGIPAESDVTILGEGPPSGVSVDDDGSPPVQYARTDTNDLEEFADNYLEAAAGDAETALNRVKAFQAPDLAARFPTGNDIKVIRETERPLYSPGDSEITFIVQVVGTLKANGVLQPADGASSGTRYKLRIGSVSGQEGLFVLDAPQAMLMTDQTLNSFYQRRTIYWWNNENTGLVPDLRYMPRSVPTVQQPTTILGWLTGAPAPWLSDAVNSLPTGTQAADNVPAITNDTLEIRLNDKAVPPGADPGVLDRLRRQLQWSMQPVPRVISIAVGHNEPVRVENGEFFDSNLAYNLTDDPERFAILGGGIRRLKGSPRADDELPVIKPAANRNIASAAISASATRAYAAVVTGPAGQRRLRVADAPLGEQADLTEVVGLGGSLGTPVWAQLPSGGEDTQAIGLITQGGQVYSFAGAGSRAQRVEWQGNPGPVSALAVAPDGHRVAVVSEGRLYRAALSTSGDGITLGVPEQVLPPSLQAVTAVAWSSEDYLVVAGARRDGRYAVLDVTVDGGLSTVRLDDIGAERVTFLSAYPSNPVTGTERSSSESYMAGGEAFDVLSAPDKITTEHLAGPPVPPGSDAKPTAPFFLD